MLYNWWILTIMFRTELAVDVDGKILFQQSECIKGWMIIDFVEAFRTCPK